jgi:hypothetical protein
VDGLPDVGEVFNDSLKIEGKYLRANAFHLGKQLFYLVSIVNDGGPVSCRGFNNEVIIGNALLTNCPESHPM